MAEDASDTCSQCSNLDSSRQGKPPTVHQGHLSSQVHVDSPVKSLEHSRTPPTQTSRQGSSSWQSPGREASPRNHIGDIGAIVDEDGQKVAWNPAVQAAPSFNRLQQMARTISELQAEVALWKRSSQVPSLSTQISTFRIHKDPLVSKVCSSCS